jgi:hypothetical protein
MDSLAGRPAVKTAFLTRSGHRQAGCCDREAGFRPYQSHDWADTVWNSEREGGNAAVELSGSVRSRLAGGGVTKFSESAVAKRLPLPG